MITVNEVMNLNDGVIYFNNKLIFKGDIATKECFDTIYKTANNNTDFYDSIYKYVEDYAPDIIWEYEKEGGDVYTKHFDDIVDISDDFVNNERDEESGFDTFYNNSDGLEWFMEDGEVYESCKPIKEDDYSETDEFTFIKEMNHWIKALKTDFVDDSKAQKAIADYFYYDDGKHQEDFKELQSSAKTLHKLWSKLDKIVEDVEEKEYKKSKNESYRLKEEDTQIEVENPGLLEVPEGKNVDDLPLSHFVKLVNKKGLDKIVRGLNNLQVWNKNKDPKLSKWAGDMIDKLNKKLKKEESCKRFVKEDYKDDLKKFADANKDELGTIAYKNGYQLHYKPYYRPTTIDGDFTTVICFDLDEVNNKADIDKLDKAFDKFFKKFDFRYFIEELPRVKRLCIYY